MYVAKTVEGLEEITAEEVKGKKIEKQRVSFSKLKKEIKTADKVYELWGRCEFSSMDDLVEKIIKISRAKKGTKYALLCSRNGEHAFKSVDVLAVVGRKLREEGITVDYKNADEKIFIDIEGSHCFVGKLIFDDKCKRPYRVRYNNKSISSCIAAALVKWAGIKKGESMLDPLCKDAVIAVEAYMMGIRNVHAIDPLKNNVRNAAVNCKYAKTKIKPLCYDVTWLDTLFKKKAVDYMITNVFLSKHDEEPEKMVKELFHQAYFIVKKGVGIITNKSDIIKSYAEKFSLIDERKIVNGGMQYTMLKFKKS